MALPIWAWYMKDVFADSTLGYLPSDKFEKPMKKLTVETDCKDFRKENQSSLQLDIIDGDGEMK